MRHTDGRDGPQGHRLDTLLRPPDRPCRAPLRRHLLALVACGASVGASVSPPTRCPAAEGARAVARRPVEPTPSATSTAPAPHTSLASSSSSPSARSAAAALKLKRAFAASSGCLSRSGVSIPAPDRSSPTLSLKGVDTKSPSYRRASAACIPVLNAALKVATKAQPRVAPRSSAGAPAPGGVVDPLDQGAGERSVHRDRGSRRACAATVSRLPKPHGASFDLSGAHVSPHSPRYKAAEYAVQLDPAGVGSSWLAATKPRAQRQVFRLGGTQSLQRTASPTETR